MSLYNTIIAVIRCPSCGQKPQVEMQIEFGLKNFLQYKIGDTVQWLPRKAVHNGGRPEDGCLTVEAYGICPLCRHDFFVPIEIEHDRIKRVVTEAARVGYDSQKPSNTHSGDPQ
ncbi:MAG: hypothetical protein JW841_01260 [Deltaproteobacteria bacterium]|nr:hypothetical protein [Deltaproteobacteria bacterium]